MSGHSTIKHAPEIPSFAPRLYGIGLLVAGIVLTGMLLIHRYATADLARDMQAWQEKLNLIAESRTADVNHWVADNFKELHTLADNPSLQLYMTELQMMQSPGQGTQTLRPDVEPSQKAYLRNLLIFTAQRAGFSALTPLATIPANVQPESKSGLAIINSQNELVVSTVMESATRDTMLGDVQHVAPGQDALIDMRKDKDGTPYIGFVVPIFSIQGDQNATSQIGRVAGIKVLDGSALFGLLKHPGTTEETLETILVRRGGDKVEYLSPLQDGTAALNKEAAFDPAATAAADLIQTTGNFIYDLKDYRGKTVLATSRDIAGTPWTLIVKIDRQEALAQSNERRASMIVFFFLIIVIIVLIVVAIWWLAQSKRSLMMSTYFRHLAARTQAQERLLRLVSDNQPEPIYIVDSRRMLHFANTQAADAAGMSVDSMPGKTLSDVRGAAQAAYIGDLCDKALEDQQVTYDVQRQQEEGGERVIRSAYVPLSHIPIVTLPESTPGVLVVEQDISAVIHERERRLETQRQLIETLVRLVDKRDPFAANHSQLVSQIAHEIAIDMELDNITVETTSFAGSLMNIGKIVVPTELLTKTESLSSDEKRAIRDSMTTASELLANIHFDGPVAETLRQWQEKWDGTGPLGLRGENILISARIIAVANAFVGMISPRSWRTAMPIDQASQLLLDQCGTHFDRRVVVALINYVENHQGKAWLKKVLDAHKAA